MAREEDGKKGRELKKPDREARFIVHMERKHGVTLTRKDPDASSVGYEVEKAGVKIGEIKTEFADRAPSVIEQALEDALFELPGVKEDWMVKIHGSAAVNRCTQKQKTGIKNVIKKIWGKWPEISACIKRSCEEKSTPAATAKLVKGLEKQLGQGVIRCATGIDWLCWGDGVFGHDTMSGAIVLCSEDTIDLGGTPTSYTAHTIIHEFMHVVDVSGIHPHHGCGCEILDDCVNPHFYMVPAAVCEK
ncbi:hypothetical protein ACFL2T_03195 [Elusimicrobiota bacterium]